MGLGAHGDGPDARPLRRRAAAAFTRCYWRITLWDHEGVPHDSPVAVFETGMMQTGNWQGSWIGDNRDIHYKPAPVLPQGVHGRTSDPLGPCLHCRSRTLRALPQRRAGRRPPSRPALYALRPPQPLRHLRRHAAVARGGERRRRTARQRMVQPPVGLRSGTSNGPRGATARPSASTCASSTTTAAKRR